MPTARWALSRGSLAQQLPGPVWCQSRLPAGPERIWKPLTCSQPGLRCQEWSPESRSGEEAEEAGPPRGRGSGWPGYLLPKRGSWGAGESSLRRGAKQTPSQTLSQPPHCHLRPRTPSPPQLP